jgi:hypothetical protein
MSSKLFACGDTHGEIDSQKLELAFFPEQASLTKNDVLVQLGDFGWIIYPFGENQKQEDALDELAGKNFTLAVVPGNHENFDIIFQLPIIEKWGGKVRVLSRKTGNIFLLERGEIYIINGKSCFVFGGALSIDKDTRILGYDYWEQEIPTWQEFNYGMDSLDKVNWNVDYVFTHTCPINIISEIIHKTVYTEGKYKDQVSVYLYQIYKNLKFKEWYFGHFHTDVRVDFSDTDDGIFHCMYNNKPYQII